MFPNTDRMKKKKNSTLAKERAGHHLIIVKDGSKSGFVLNIKLVFKAGYTTSDHHNQMNYNNFEKLLREKLILNILSKSVICIDSAAYWTKILNPVPYNIHWIEKNCTDELLESHNHDVVKFPPYHCEMKSNSEFSIKLLSKLIKEATENVKEKNWSNYCKQVEGNIGT